MVDELRDDRILEVSFGCMSLDEVAWKLDLEANEETLSEILKVCPVVESQVQINMAMSSAQECLDCDDKDGVKYWRSVMMRAMLDKGKAEEQMVLDELASDRDNSDDPLDYVFDPHYRKKATDVSLMFPEEVVPDELSDKTKDQKAEADPNLEDASEEKCSRKHSVDKGQASVKITGSGVRLISSGKRGKRGGVMKGERRRPTGARDLIPSGHLKLVEPADVESTSIMEYILGYTGETYRGRPVVLFKKCPEAFGCQGLKRESRVRYTLHNGIINHMEIGDMSRDPTPYWAVLDAASELKIGFSVEQVLSRALVTVGDDNQLEACRTSWYVLKSHQTHPKQKDRGMSFIIDEVEVEGKKVTSVRGRHPDETHQHFEQGRLERKAVRSLKAAKDIIEDMVDDGSLALSPKEMVKEIEKEEEVPLATVVVGKAR